MRSWWGHLLSAICAAVATALALTQKTQHMWGALAGVLVQFGLDGALECVERHCYKASQRPLADYAVNLTQIVHLMVLTPILQTQFVIGYTIGNTIMHLLHAFCHYVNDLRMLAGELLHD